MRQKQPDLHEVIALIYEAAAGDDPALWQHFSAVLGNFHRACLSGIMLFPDPLLLGPVAMAVTGVGESASADYTAEFHRHDLLSHAALAGGGALVRSDEVIDMGKFDRHVFWNEFNRPNTGAWHGMAQGGVGQGHGMMIVCREKGDHAFNAAEERDFQILRGHVNRALLLAERLGGQRLGIAAFETMRHPALVIDVRGRFQFANQTAIDLLARHGILLVRGTAALPALAANGAVGAAIEAVLRGEAEVIARLPSRNGPGLVLARFGRMPPAFGGIGDANASDAILVTLLDLHHGEDDPGAIGAVFDLTAAEAQVGQLLLQGLTAPQIAVRRGVSELTVRSQLERLVSKTGSANLRECAIRLDRAGRL